MTTAMLPWVDGKDAALSLDGGRTRHRVFAMRYLRKSVLKLTRPEMAALLQCSMRTVYTYENQPDIDVDTFPLHYIRLCRAYAKEHGITWPATLTTRLLEGEFVLMERRAVGVEQEYD